MRVNELQNENALMRRSFTQQKSICYQCFGAFYCPTSFEMKTLNDTNSRTAQKMIVKYANEYQRIAYCSIAV